MNWTYLLILAGTIFGPIILSFDKNIRYVKSWKYALMAAVIVAVPFIIWDAIFTHYKFWGFNDEHNLGIRFFDLPLEEILFFILVPFACTFIYECCKYFMRNKSFLLFNRIFAFLIPLYALTLVFIGNIGFYTVTSIIAASVVLFWMMKNNALRFIPIAFCITLIPFAIVNGILTGGMTESPVVWYNEAQKVDFRIFTIPMEDVLYNFALLASNMILFEKLKHKFSK